MLRSIQVKPALAPLVDGGQPVAAKFCLLGPSGFAHHRSGWQYAIESLKPLLKSGGVVSGGVVLDSFVESTFGWNLVELQNAGVLPYRGDWVGFVHNPPGIPVWHEYSTAPQSLFSQAIWQQSLATCRGLYTFSRTMQQWLIERLPVPVEALIHPTELPSRTFDLTSFRAQHKPRIVQVGAWLRRINSLPLLPVTKLQKSCLIPRSDGDDYLAQLIAREQANEPSLREADWSSVELLPYLGPAGFDELLSGSIVFLDLYDTVVNNTVIECIVRGVPLVCNRLPAIVELLGDDYPLFFSTLIEAAAKAEDMNLVAQAATHMASLPKEIFSGAHFAACIANSPIYRDLV